MPPDFAGDPRRAHAARRFAQSCAFSAILALQAPLSLAGDFYGTELLAVTHTMIYENGTSGCVRGSDIFVPGNSYSYQCEYLRVDASIQAAPSSRVDGSYGIYRKFDDIHPNYSHRASLWGITSWHDQLVIHSGSLPAGTEVWLEVGTQVDVSYLRATEAGHAARASAWVTVSDPHVTTSGLAPVEYGDSGWSDRTQITSGLFDSGSGRGRGISSDKIGVKVGETVNVIMHLDAAFGVMDPAWWEVEKWIGGNGQAIAHHSISLQTMQQEGAEMLAGEAEPDLYYTAASGFSYPTSLPVPVPEPATWWMFCAGIVVLIGLVRRRRGLQCVV